jgi:regulation of enolase protein 1 (concanavalin A-like superfamily)
MTSTVELSGIPFPLSATHPDVFDVDGEVVVGRAPRGTDLYVDPAGGGGALPSAPALLGRPPAGDFRLSARVGVDFAASFDAGVLLLWLDERNWAKLCFEHSPDGEPMVVSVVTRGVSDDANAFTVDGRSVWLRISRVDAVYAFHASTDGSTWKLVRVFTLGDVVDEHTVGLEAQSPTGEGCVVRFDEVRFSAERLEELRDGS